MSLYFAKASYSDSLCSIPINGVVQLNSSCLAPTSPAGSCVPDNGSWSKSICTTSTNEAEAFRKLVPNNGFYSQGECNSTGYSSDVIFTVFSGCSSTSDSSTRQGVHQNDLVTATYIGPNCLGDPYMITNDRAGECIYFSHGKSRLITISYADDSAIAIKSPSTGLTLSFNENSGDKTTYALDLSYGKPNCTGAIAATVNPISNCDNFSSQCKSSVLGTTTKSFCIEAESPQAAINKASPGLDVISELSYSDSSCTVPTSTQSGFGYAFYGQCKQESSYYYESLHFEGEYLLRDWYATSDCTGTPYFSAGYLVGQCRPNDGNYLKTLVYSEKNSDPSSPVDGPADSSRPSSVVSGDIGLAPILDSLLAVALLV